eukprot:ANDGO_08446.mRNA.1 putative protein ariadne-2
MSIEDSVGMPLRFPVPLFDVGDEATYEVSSGKFDPGQFRRLDRLSSSYWQSDSSVRPHWIDITLTKPRVLWGVQLCSRLEYDNSFVPLNVSVVISDRVEAASPGSTLIQDLDVRYEKITHHSLPNDVAFGTVWFTKGPQPSFSGVSPSAASQKSVLNNLGAKCARIRLLLTPSGINCRLRFVRLLTVRELDLTADQLLQPAVFRVSSKRLQFHEESLGKPGTLVRVSLARSHGTDVWVPKSLVQELWGKHPGEVSADSDCGIVMQDADKIRGLTAGIIGMIKEFSSNSAAKFAECFDTLLPVLETLKTLSQLRPSGVLHESGLLSLIVSALISSPSNSLLLSLLSSIPVDHHPSILYVLSRFRQCPPSDAVLSLVAKWLSALLVNSDRMRAGWSMYFGNTEVEKLTGVLFGCHEVSKSPSALIAFITHFFQISSGSGSRLSEEFLSDLVRQLDDSIGLMSFSPGELSFLFSSETEEPRDVDSHAVASQSTLFPREKSAVIREMEMLIEAQQMDRQQGNQRERSALTALHVALSADSPPKLRMHPMDVGDDAESAHEEEDSEELSDDGSPDFCESPSSLMAPGEQRENLGTRERIALALFTRVSDDILCLLDQSRLLKKVNPIVVRFITMLSKTTLPLFAHFFFIPFLKRTRLFYGILFATHLKTLPWMQFVEEATSFMDFEKALFSEVHFNEKTWNVLRHTVMFSLFDGGRLRSLLRDTTLAGPLKDLICVDPFRPSADLRHTRLLLRICISSPISSHVEMLLSVIESLVTVGFGDLFQKPTTVSTDCSDVVSWVNLHQTCVSNLGILIGSFSIARRVCGQALQHSLRTLNEASCILVFGRLALCLHLLLDSTDGHVFKNSQPWWLSSQDALLDPLLQFLNFVPLDREFAHFYEKYLSRRLLRSSARSIELELHVIHELSCVDLGKCRRMLSDVMSSISLTSQFDSYALSAFDLKHLSEASKPTFDARVLSVRLLTSSIWHPFIRSLLDAKYNVPEAISKSLAQFEQFYATIHPDRKVKFLLAVGSVTLAYGKAVLHLCPLQASILLSFNDRPRWNIDDLRASLGFTKGNLLSDALQILTSFGVLEVSGRVVQLKFSFKSDSAAVTDLPHVLSLVDEENVGSLPSTDVPVLISWRRQVLDSFLVRIVKSNSSRQPKPGMPYDELVKEAVSRVSFSVPLQQIHSRISRLVDAGFLAVKDHGQWVRYVNEKQDQNVAHASQDSSIVKEGRSSWEIVLECSCSSTDTLRISEEAFFQGFWKKILRTRVTVDTDLVSAAVLSTNLCASIVSILQNRVTRLHDSLVNCRDRDASVSLKKMEIMSGIRFEFPSLSDFLIASLPDTAMQTLKDLYHRLSARFPSSSSNSATLRSWLAGCVVHADLPFHDFLESIPRSCDSVSMEAFIESILHASLLCECQLSSLAMPLSALLTEFAASWLNCVLSVADIVARAWDLFQEGDVVRVRIYTGTIVSMSNRETIVVRLGDEGGKEECAIQQLHVAIPLSAQSRSPPLFFKKQLGDVFRCIECVNPILKMRENRKSSVSVMAGSMVEQVWSVYRKTSYDMSLGVAKQRAITQLQLNAGLHEEPINRIPESALFESVSEGQILKTIQEAINQVCECFSIDYDTSLALLTLYGWSIPLLVEALGSQSFKIPIICDYQEIVEPFLCAICYTESQKGCHLGCGHVFCDHCWRSYLDSKLDNRDILIVHCMEPSCTDHVLPYSKVQHLNQSVSQHLQKSLLESYSLQKRIQPCQNHRGCTSFISTVPGFYSYRLHSDPSWAKSSATGASGTTVVCSDCSTAFCASCRAPDHFPATCDWIKDWISKGGYAETDSDEDTASLRLKALTTRPCPVCNTLIEKQGGCPHMQCSSCKTDFCFHCLGSYPNCFCQSGVRGAVGGSAVGTSVHERAHLFRQFNEQCASYALAKEVSLQLAAKFSSISSSETFDDRSGSHRLEELCRLLARSNSLLAHACISLYFLPDSSLRSLFEFNFEELKVVVNRVQTELERNIRGVLEWKRDDAQTVIQELQRMIRVFCSVAEEVSFFKVPGHGLLVCDVCGEGVEREEWKEHADGHVAEPSPSPMVGTSNMFFSSTQGATSKSRGSLHFSFRSSQILPVWRCMVDVGVVQSLLSIAVDVGLHRIRKADLGVFAHLSADKRMHKVFDISDEAGDNGQSLLNTFIQAQGRVPVGFKQ